MKYTWLYYTSKVEEQIVDKIVEKSLKEDLIDGTINLVTEDSKNIVGVDKSIRNTKIAFLDRMKHPDIYNLIYNLGLEVNNKAYGFDLNNLETCQFTLYDSKNKGKYDWHIDTDWISDNCYHRKVSVVLQLSDPSEYEGGKLEIRNSGCTEQDKINMMQKGSVITFPSFMEHRVTPVTKGKRLSLIGWMLGAKFR